MIRTDKASRSTEGIQEPSCQLGQMNYSYTDISLFTVVVLHVIGVKQTLLYMNAVQKTA